MIDLASHERNRPVLLDVSRLIARCRRPGLSGIDRVELEYVLRLSSQPELHLVFVAWIDGGLYHIHASLLSVLRDRLAERWLGAAVSRSPLASLARFAVEKMSCRRRIFEAALVSTGVRLEAGGNSFSGAIYLNVSHSCLEYLDFIREEVVGSDGRIMVMIHDLMPITSPEFFSPEFCASFTTRVRRVAEEADCVLANSETTASQWRQWCDDEERRSPPLTVQRLGVHRCGEERGFPSDSPYFVFVGTSTARKNIARLLDVWRALEERGETSARLVVIGTPDQVPTVELERLSASARSRIVFEVGLDDASVRAMMIGARALLLPSLVEGFGLPVAEAGVLGVPVLCSDLPALREFGDFPTFLDPHDTDAWADQIVSLCAGSREASRVLDGVATWEEHVDGAVSAGLRLADAADVRKAPKSSGRVDMQRADRGNRNELQRLLRA